MFIINVLLKMGVYMSGLSLILSGDFMVMLGLGFGVELRGHVLHISQYKMVLKARQTRFLG